jgi:cyclomaltodextrinase
VTGGDDPFNRATYPWADQGGKPDLDLRAYVKKLIALRHAEPVLRRGTLDAPLFADATAIVLLRRLGERWAITATHNADMPRTLTLTLPAGAPTAGWADALGGGTAAAANGQLTLQLPALGGVVLLASSPAAR